MLNDKYNMTNFGTQIMNYFTAFEFTLIARGRNTNRILQGSEELKVCPITDTYIWARYYILLECVYNTKYINSILGFTGLRFCPVHATGQNCAPLNQ